MDGAACVPPGNACQSGKISCITGEAVCIVAGDVSDGTTCEAGICCGGLCAACSLFANAVAVCSGTICSFSCSTGFTLCGGSCVDATSDSQACGPSCAPCAVGSLCEDSECAAISMFGNSVAYSPCVESQAGEAGYLVGERLYIEDDIEVTALGVIGAATEPASGVHGIMGLYSDMGGLPYALMANTLSTTIGPGNNMIPVVSVASVSAGFYWIMAEYDATAFICGDDATDNPIAGLQAGYGGLPATITNPDASSTDDFNYYVLGTLSTQ
jgi:hypothetical protein